MNKLINTLCCLICFIAFTSCVSQRSKQQTISLQTEKQVVKKKILFVVTSHGIKGNTGKKTGYYLGEVSHPWEVLVEAGYEIDFVSPKGGNPPVDAFDLTDSVNKKFWEDAYYHKKISNSLKPVDVKPQDYAAIYFAGGHGAMWDLPNDTTIAGIVAKVYEQDGVVAGVCHGPAGLLNIRLGNGKYLIEGKKVNGFSNQEEEIVKLTAVVPFLLEDKLKERGGIYEKTEPFQSHVVVDGRLITGQNPQSAKAVGDAILLQLKSKNR
ncbi:type 1 glutamine amidotransferase domain-containing protein [Pedobacter hiemivivus]|uniref:Type 1 glutamine amidotransferase domain-containing protein n=1 Tax=Pedobacter hiemivivus TaxID=2530454 RepID=A0A4R0N469_9SPHI|nr:type 1 glutamine amidotransferase domain-containing protein [Pedobacter hiemivivus]TCC94701.1 type 1 glutamine amidotransferase domain-containing protein [Pedobacter hiemivivus]